MASALRRAGVEVALLRFEDEVYDFLIEANRLEFYERLGAFFEKHLGPN
jgi:dipeptidyl aminopeptidase/acylaminoacyl peptidase